jgi:hypothetical protein
VIPLAFRHTTAKVARRSTAKRQVVQIRGEGGFEFGHGSDIESGSG